MQPLDARAWFRDPPQDPASLSRLARVLRGSQILGIATEIRALAASGVEVCDLTLGDFSPSEFAIPLELRDALLAAVKNGETNYPPADGTLELRAAVREYYERDLGLDYPIESVLIASGARPLIYAAYRLLADPGDGAIFAVPSWNNVHFAAVSGLRPIALVGGPETGFFPEVSQFEPHVGAASLIVINSPSNPAGTIVPRELLRGVCQLVVDENRRRARAGARPLWLCFDQVYWHLTFGSARHTTPPAELPEVTPYTLLVDAASKSFAATGLRVGWALMPPHVRARMADFLGHVGAWAPKPEQLAMASFLGRRDAVAAWRRQMLERVQAKLTLLAEGLEAFRRRGLPIRPLTPQGAIYLSVNLAVRGWSSERTRRWLLDEARIAVVPFSAFGFEPDSGWFRMSVGAASDAGIQRGLERLGRAIGKSAELNGLSRA